MNRRINRWLEDIRNQVKGLVYESFRPATSAAVDKLVAETAVKLAEDLELDEDKALDLVFEHLEVPGADSTVEEMAAWLGGVGDSLSLKTELLARVQGGG